MVAAELGAAIRRYPAPVGRLRVDPGAGGAAEDEDVRQSLELHLALDSGHEVECAKFLRARLPDPAWLVLAALAAEIVAVHEAQAAGVRTVVVQASEAEVADILRGRCRQGGSL